VTILNSQLTAQYTGTGWLSGRFDALHPEGCRGLEKGAIDISGMNEWISINAKICYNNDKKLFVELGLNEANSTETNLNFCHLNRSFSALKSIGYSERRLVVDDEQI